MHEVLVNRLGGLSLPRKSVVRLTDRPDMTLDVYRGRKKTIQQQQQNMNKKNLLTLWSNGACNFSDNFHSFHKRFYGILRKMQVNKMMLHYSRRKGEATVFFFFRKSS